MEGLGILVEGISTVEDVDGWGFGGSGLEVVSGEEEGLGGREGGD